MKLDIARAWKDEAYRQSLSSEELALLPENPAGELELNDAELGSVQGGGGFGQLFSNNVFIGCDQHNSQMGHCGSYGGSCQSVDGNCSSFNQSVCASFNQGSCYSNFGNCTSANGGTCVSIGRNSCNVRF